MGLCGVGVRRALGFGFAFQLSKSLGRDHMSALGMTLNMCVETLWCYAVLHLAASDGGVRSGWAACSWRRIRGVLVGNP